MSQTTTIPNHPAINMRAAAQSYSKVRLTAQSGPARTARQREVEKKHGKTYEWRRELSKQFWKRAAEYSDADMVRARAFDKALVDGFKKNLPAANLIAGALSADADKHARNLSQSAHNVPAVEQIVRAAGMSTDVLTYKLIARVRTAGVTPWVAHENGVMDHPATEGIEFCCTMNLHRLLPEFRKAVLAANFKNQRDLVKRPGFLTGVFYYDGGVRASGVEITVDDDAVANTVAMLGAPSSQYQSARGLTRLFWQSRATRGECARRLHANLDGAACFLNPRKVEAVQKLIDNA